jgi:hypothetical protein
MIPNLLENNGGCQIVYNLLDSNISSRVKSQTKNE